MERGRPLRSCCCVDTLIIGRESADQLPCQVVEKVVECRLDYRRKSQGNSMDNSCKDDMKTSPMKR